MMMVLMIMMMLVMVMVFAGDGDEDDVGECVQFISHSTTAIIIGHDSRHQLPPC